MAFDQNDSGSTFADDGTASHAFAELCLANGRDADFYIGASHNAKGVDYLMDQERADYVQSYVDDVRSRALGGQLFTEVRVDLSKWLGEDQGGTADAVILQPERSLLIVEDLKYGMGEKVYAKYTDETGTVRPNPQAALYALGALDFASLFATVKNVLLVIHQPRLNHVDEYPMTVADLLEFGDDARVAVEVAREAMAADAIDEYLNPGEKTCRWCKAKAICPKLRAKIAADVKLDFDTFPVDPPPQAPIVSDQLAQSYQALPLIRDWCNAVESALTKLVADGKEVLGPDGKPYKFVEGREGKRAWADPKAAEALLLGQLPPDKAYKPAEIITAPAAAKLLDRKATKQLWADVFAPLVKRGSAARVLALGSDPRPPYTGAAGADEFEELGE
jgi:hypothetical protein